LRGLWRKNVRDLEVLRPEVDSGGYDLALEFRGLNRTQPIVVRLTGRESEMDREAIGVHDRVNLAR
jgi:hypothetical protein